MTLNYHIAYPKDGHSTYYVYSYLIRLLLKCEKVFYALPPPLPVAVENIGLES